MGIANAFPAVPMPIGSIKALNTAIEVIGGLSFQCQLVQLKLIAIIKTMNNAISSNANWFN